MDNLANAPPGGAYLLVLYAGEVGPQHVDWFWQPKSKARIPDDEKVLFDRVGPPVAPGAELLGADHRPPGSLMGDVPRVAVLTHKITYFWAMSMIVSKGIARRDSETVARMTSRIARTLTETAQLLDSHLSLPGVGAAQRSATPSANPIGQFDLLYGLGRDATRLHEELVAQGVAVPSEAIRHIYRFYELTQSMTSVRT